jgi:hypothetical protein
MTQVAAKLLIPRISTMRMQHRVKSDAAWRRSVTLSFEN